MVEIVEWAVARAREPSTYAGLAGILASYHIADAQSWANNIVPICIGAAGCVAMFLKENKFGQ